VEGGDETRAAAAAGEGGNRDDDELIDHDGFSSGRSHEEGRLQPFWISKVDLDLISQHLVRELPTHSRAAAFLNKSAMLLYCCTELN
jgi:hypothetical protein